jgi:hypothetical protein
MKWMRVLNYKRVLGAKSLKRLHCHLSGIEYTEKGERKHLMLADSDFDLKGLMRALAEMGRRPHCMRAQSWRTARCAFGPPGALIAGSRLADPYWGVVAMRNAWSSRRSCADAPACPAQVGNSITSLPASLS